MKRVDENALVRHTSETVELGEFVPTPELGPDTGKRRISKENETTLRKIMKKAAAAPPYWETRTFDATIAPVERALPKASDGPTELLSIAWYVQEIRDKIALIRTLLAQGMPRSQRVRLSNSARSIEKLSWCFRWGSLLRPAAR